MILRGIPMMANVGNVTSLFNPATIAGLKLWLKADTLALADTAPVSTWSDQSGNGNDATQSGSGRPLLSTTSFAINGHQVVFFNLGSPNQTMNLTSSISGGTWTVLVVMKPFGSGYPMYSISSVSGGQGCPLGPYIDGANNVNMGRQDIVISDGAITSGTAHVFTASSVAATSQSLYIDGVSQSGTAGSTSGTTTGFDILGDRGSIGGIAELLVYDSVLGSTDRGNVETYLKTKYGL
jgi:hypothetical protein